MQIESDLPVSLSPESKRTPRVFICSPYRPQLPLCEGFPEEIEDQISQSLVEHRMIVLTACAFAVKQGKFPVAPHAYFPNFLNDDIAEERLLGIGMGLELLMECDELWVMSEEVTSGMSKEIAVAKTLGKPTQYFTPDLEKIASKVDPLECFTPNTTK